MTRVLFVPYATGGPSHQIPLIRLARMLDPGCHEVSFLLARSWHRAAQLLGLPVLDIDHRGFRTEMQAYGEFRPDVVVDDASISTGFASRLVGLPRIAIQRTGMFPGGVPRMPGLRHSMGSVEEMVRDLPSASFLGLARPSSFAGLFDAPLKLVPGLPSIEVLPADLAEDPTYLYTGPLLMEDQLVADLDLSGLASGQEAKVRLSRDFGALETFFSAHRGRPLIYLTYGLIAEPPAELVEAITALLRRGFGVVTSVEPGDLPGELADRCFFARYLPMHRICSQVDLMVHHCGSGTYQYPILHRLPSISLGTGCFDREDVALRLEELGASCHLPAPAGDEGFLPRFLDLVSRFTAPGGELARRCRAALETLAEELRRTEEAFDFAAALAACRSLRPLAAGHAPHQPSPVQRHPLPAPSHRRATHGGP